MNEDVWRHASGDDLYYFCRVGGMPMMMIIVMVHGVVVVVVEYVIT